jgi:hypothetical protein
MPNPSLLVTVREANDGIDRLIQYRAVSRSLEPSIQHLICELILLRLSAILESTVHEIACKLIAGATYANGVTPSRLHAAGSIAKAESTIFTLRRKRRGRYLSWGWASDIKDNLWDILDNGDPFITYSNVHAALFDEMRRVRNYVAHKSDDARKGFYTVVRARYGAIRQVSPGAFLISTTRWRTARIDDYLAGTKVIISDLCKG